MDILKRFYNNFMLLVIGALAFTPFKARAAGGILPDVSSGPITNIHFLETYIGPGGTIVKFIEGTAGIIAVAMFVWGGFLLVTSGGDPEKVEKGKKALYAAAIGVVIVVSSYAIIYIVVTLLGGKIS